jgi:hypothetical protein
MESISVYTNTYTVNIHVHTHAHTHTQWELQTPNSENWLFLLRRVGRGLQQDRYPEGFNYICNALYICISWMLVRGVFTILFSIYFICRKSHIHNHYFLNVGVKKVESVF